MKKFLIKVLLVSGLIVVGVGNHNYQTKEDYLVGKVAFGESIESDEIIKGEH